MESGGGLCCANYRFACQAEETSGLSCCILNQTNTKQAMVSRTGQAVLLPMLLMHVAVLMVTAPRASTATQRSTASFSSFFPSQQVTEAEFFSTIYQRHTHVDKANSTNSDGSALAHFNALIGGGDDVLMLADVNMLCNAVMDLGAPSSALKVCVCVCVCVWVGGRLWCECE